MQQPKLPSTIKVVDEIFKGIAEAGQVTDEQLTSLHFLLEKHFAKAVQIVDQGGVFCFVGEQSGRKAYQVQGQTSSDRYTVYPWHYCSCQAFFYDVVSKQEAHFCKHQIATRLADALQKVRVSTVSDLVVADILQGQ